LTSQRFFRGACSKNVALNWSIGYSPAGRFFAEGAGLTRRLGHRCDAITGFSPGLARGALGYEEEGSPAHHRCAGSSASLGTKNALSAKVNANGGATLQVAYTGPLRR